MGHNLSSLGIMSHQDITEQSQKPKMLVVDDEPDNLDLLYRTFRREFQILRAESGAAGLELLATAGEVAVIISDQRMPEMKGTEFLSKTVPQFPNTMRIILTGFTDVEDLVEAINSGQVYKYITKPWDPSKLKAVVQQATEIYRLLKQRTHELRQAQAQMSLLTTMVQAVQDASCLEDCLQPIATAFGQTFSANVCILQPVRNQSLIRPQGIYVAACGTPQLSIDSTAERAIATQMAQVAINIFSDQSFPQLEHGVNNGVHANLIIPVISQDHVIAILSLQWQEPFNLSDDELMLIHLAAQQVTLALTCQRFWVAIA